MPFLTSELSQGFIQIEAISSDVSPPLSWVSPLCPIDSSGTWPNQPGVHIHPPHQRAHKQERGGENISSDGVVGVKKKKDLTLANGWELQHFPQNIWNLERNLLLHKKLYWGLWCVCECGGVVGWGHSNLDTKTNLIKGPYHAKSTLFLLLSVL